MRKESYGVSADLQKLDQRKAVLPELERFLSQLELSGAYAVDLADKNETERALNLPYSSDPIPVADRWS
jgi:hypothetical protein